MKLQTKIDKGKYVLELKEVPRQLRFNDALHKKEFQDTMTMGEIREYVTAHNTKRLDIINANSKEREQMIHKFKDDMAKEVERQLKIKGDKAVKIANKVYNENQGSSHQELLNALNRELTYLNKLMN